MLSFEESYAESIERIRYGWERGKHEPNMVDDSHACLFIVFKDFGFQCFNISLV